MSHYYNIPYEVRQSLRQQHEARFKELEAERLQAQRVNEYFRQKHEREAAERAKAEAERARKWRIDHGCPLRGDMPDEDYMAWLERKQLIAQLAAEKIARGHYSGVWTESAHAAYVERAAWEAATDAGAGAGDYPNATTIGTAAE